MRWAGMSRGRVGLVETHIRERSSTQGKRGKKKRRRKHWRLALKSSPSIKQTLRGKHGAISIFARVVKYEC